MRNRRFRIMLFGAVMQLARLLKVSLAAVAGVCWLLAGPSFAQVSSYAFVNDDGSLRIKGRTYRLHGVYIPPTAQSCRTFERPVPCGSRAALALDFKIQGFVRCERRHKNDDGTVSAYCTTDGEDLAAYLLERGWALALPDAPFEYQALEKIARHRGLGVWGFPVEQRIQLRMP
jgi:endonuclease YncB( thermonuclease family)